MMCLNKRFNSKLRTQRTLLYIHMSSLFPWPHSPFSSVQFLPLGILPLGVPPLAPVISSCIFLSYLLDFIYIVKRYRRHGVFHSLWHVLGVFSFLCLRIVLLCFCPLYIWRLRSLISTWSTVVCKVIGVWINVLGGESLRVGMKSVPYCACVIGFMWYSFAMCAACLNAPKNRRCLTGRSQYLTTGVPFSNPHTALCLNPISFLLVIWIVTDM